MSCVIVQVVFLILDKITSSSDNHISLGIVVCRIEMNNA